MTWKTDLGEIIYNTALRDKKEKYERKVKRHGGQNEKFPHMWVEIPEENRKMSKEKYVKI